MTIIMSPKSSPILIRASIVAGVAVAIWLIFALGNGGSQAMEKPEKLFAASLKVSAGDVAEICPVQISGVAGLSGVVIGTYTKAGATAAAAVPLYLDQGKATPGPVETLGPGRAVQFVDLIDLKAGPRKVALTPPPCPAGGHIAKADGQTAPTLLLKVVEDGGEAQESLILLSLGKPPGNIWTEKTTSIASNGAGHETVDMRLETHDGHPLAIVLVQQSFAARAGSDYMPGPPLTLRFEERDGRYRQVGK